MSSRLAERALRKRLLRLEAESHRLEMVATFQELRRPKTHLEHAPILLGMLGGDNRLVGKVADFLVTRRLGWIVKSVPLILTGWRIATLLRTIFARPDSPERISAD